MSVSLDYNHEPSDMAVDKLALWSKRHEAFPKIPGRWLIWQFLKFLREGVAHILVPEDSNNASSPKHSVDRWSTYVNLVLFSKLVLNLLRPSLDDNTFRSRRTEESSTTRDGIEVCVTRCMYAGTR